jgi:hypothetical protein
VRDGREGGRERVYREGGEESRLTSHEGGREGGRKRNRI